jgi:tetratricopeptide (TPR) repeat protein
MGVNARQPWRSQLCLVLTSVIALGCSRARRDGVEARSQADNARPAAVATTAPAARLRLSDTPDAAELERLGMFRLPLVPVGPSTADENRALGRAILAYDAAVAQSGSRDAVAALNEFLAAHPSSVWRPALLVNLGMFYRETGHFSKALASWQSAWELTRAAQDEQARTVADAAVGRLAQLYAELGRKEALEPLLAEVKQRPLRAAAAELVSNAARNLQAMQSSPELTFKCGAFALSRILQYNTAELPFAKVAIVKAAHATPNGLSLSAVRALSERAGMRYQMAFRAPGAAIVVPAVVHWKVGHYAAVVDNHSGRYRVQETAFGDDLLMSMATLDEEASGYFLIPNGPLAAGWRALRPGEGDGVWGRGSEF